MLAFMIAVAVAADTSSIPLWEQWLNPQALDRLFQAGGLVMLAVLFARGQIITKGQHEARVADLTKYADAEKAASDANHTRELQQMSGHHLDMMREKDVRFDGMKESRDSWRDVARVQTTRADTATAQLVESNEAQLMVLQQWTALEHVLEERLDSPGGETEAKP